MAIITERKTAIQELAEHRQSLWLDNLRRQLITAGELARPRDEGVTGRLFGLIAQGKNVNVTLFFSVARTRRGECGPAFGLAIRRYEGGGARE